MIKEIVIANDHAGTPLKFKIVQFLKELGLNVKDYGTDSDESVDYPDYVSPAAAGVVRKEFEMVILICGSAQGVAITANKYKDIRAAVCWIPEIASLSRQHNNANMLCLPARFLDESTARQVVEAFLQTKFEGGRHQKRLDKISFFF